jgi:hypothetical protein
MALFCGFLLCAFVLPYDGQTPALMLVHHHQPKMFLRAVPAIVIASVEKFRLCKHGSDGLSSVF